MDKFSDYLNIRKAAEYLGVHINTLMNWEKQKKIKVYRCPQNNYRMYKKEDLDQLLEQMANSCINSLRRK